jgi:hypothetical protein
MALPSADKVKIWLFPSLISILGLMIWTDLQTIKSTLSSNTVQTVTDKTDIINIKTRVDKLEFFVYKQSKVVKSNELPINPPDNKIPLFTKIVAVKPDEQSLLIAKTINKTTL